MEGELEWSLCFISVFSLMKINDLGGGSQCSDSMEKGITFIDGDCMRRIIGGWAEDGVGWA